MATTYTTYLRLRMTDELSASARSNLQKIDALGATFVMSGTDRIVRSPGDLTLEPESAAVGGSGSGGTLNLGTSGHSLDAINAYGLIQAYAHTLLRACGELRLGDADSSHYVGFKAAETVASNVIWTLPSADGTAAQVLYTDGAGNLGWATVATDSLAQYSLRVGNASGLATPVDTNSVGDILADSTNGLTYKAESIADADVAAAAAIARSKLASGSNNHVLINSAAGVMTSEATLAKVRGGAGADMTNVTFPSAGTIATTSNKLSAFAATSSAELASVLSDENGTGTVVFSSGATLSSPTIGGAEISGGSITATDVQLFDNEFLIADNLDATKAFRFQASGISTGQTRVYTTPDADTTLVGTDTPQDLSGKTLAGAVVSDYTEFDHQASDVDAPSGSDVRLYAKSKKLYIRSADAITELGAGSGTGEKTYVTNPSGLSDAAGATPTGWGDVGDLAITVTKTAAELPREYTTASGIKVVGTGATEDTGDYVYYDFTLDDVDLNKKLKIQWSQKTTGTYTAGQLAVVVTTQADRATALHTPITTAIPASDGVFTTSFDSGSTATLSLVIRATGAVATDGGIVISDVVVGPGTQPQGAVVGPRTSFTPVFESNALGTLAASTAVHWREGENLFVQGTVTAGTVTASNANMTLPLSLVVASTHASGQVIGRWQRGNASASTRKAGNIFAIGGNAFVYFGSDDSTATVSPFNAVAANGLFANGDVISFEFTVGVTAWAGSGVLNVIQDDTLDEWTAFTPSWGNTNTLTFATSEGFKRRVGDSLHIRAYLEISGGTGAASSLTLTVPSSLTIDTAKIPGYADLPSLTHVGTWAWYDDSGSSVNLDDAHGWVALNSSTQLLFRDPSNSGSLATDELATNDRVTVDAVIPILQWRGRSGTGPVGFAMVGQSAAGLVQSAGQLLGTNTNDSAATGYVGEVLTQSRLRSAATSLTNGTSKDVTGTALTLTAGDWDVSAMVGFTGGSATVTVIEAAVSTVSNTMPANDVIAVPTSSGEARMYMSQNYTTTNVEFTLAIPTYRISLSATTTFYLQARSSFSAGTMTAYGSVRARRVR